MSAKLRSIFSFLSAIAALIWVEAFPGALYLGLALLLFRHHAFAEEVKLAWDAPKAGPTPSGYNLYYGTSSGSYGPPIDVGLSLNYSLTNLLAGTTYFFALKSYDAAANLSDAYSNEVCSSIPSMGMSLYSLQISKPSHGMVVSEPICIISCGGENKSCKASLSAVTLTAIANYGYGFKRWVGCPGSIGKTCSLALTGPTKIKAYFAKLPRYKLTVAKTKFGAIISSPTGIKCQANAKSCSAKFVKGEVVNLFPIPQWGRTFTGWTGACFGTEDCEVRMDGNKGVGASFQ